MGIDDRSKGVPSTTTLLTASQVAEAAGIPRSTLLYWVEAERVVPKYHIGDEKQTPLFTKDQQKQIVSMASDWQKWREKRVP